MNSSSSSRIVVASTLWLLAITHSFAGLWTPEDLGDRLWLDWWQEDLSNGAVSTWTTRKGSVAATQTTTAKQPTKSAGEVYFGNTQNLNVGLQSNAYLAHRAVCILFRIDLTGSGDGTIFTINGISGGNDRQPIILYNRNTNQVSVQWKTPGGYNQISWTVAEDPNQWHCIVSRRVANMHYASLDGQPEQSVTMADYAIPRSTSTGYIGDFRPSTPNMAIDSIMIVQDELSQADAEKLMGWAMWRKGIQSTLPSGHPYKNQPPLQGNGILTSQDIGSPLPAGTTTITTSNFTLAAGGSGLGTTSDSFTFASQNVMADAELIVKVDSLTNTNANAKAGLMLRASNAANSAYVGVFVRPGTNGVIMQSRATTGATSTSTTVGSLSLPRWLKLTRSGNSFTASQSSDGSTWSTVNTVSVTLPKTSLGGLAATSAVQSTAATAVFSSLSILDSTPIDEFVESTSAEWNTFKTTWDTDAITKAHKLEAPNLVGWNLVYEDNFDTHTVTNDVTGEGPWYAPTHQAATGSALTVTPTDAVPQGSPATYIQSAGTMTIRMQQDAGVWKSGVFCSANLNGYGRTWRYPYVEARMKAYAGPSNNNTGAWPAIWLKSENFFYNLTQSNLEYDIYEGYSADTKGHHSAYHHWPAVRSWPGRITSSRDKSNYCGLVTSSGWPTNVNLFDNAYHTYAVMITPEWVINYFDNKEIFRFPTSLEMKQPMWILVDLAMQSSLMSMASGTYELTVDYIKVLQNPAFSGAPIVAAFDGGSGSVSSDQYPGVAENGWTSAWGEISSTDIDANVVNTTPLTIGSGNYLQVVNNDATTGSGNDAIVRQYGSANGVTLTAAHTISFDYRLDSASTQIGSADGIFFFNNTTGTPDNSATNGFTLRAIGSGGAVKWFWFNGDKAGSGTWVDSGMVLANNKTYHFTITLDPVNKEWNISINDGTSVVSATALGYRTAAASPASLSYLCFGSRDTTSSQTITQSFDNFVITNN